MSSCLPGQRPVHRNAGAQRRRVLEVHLHLRNLGDNQRRPRAWTFYIGQAQIIHWRLWLNQRMLGDWLNDAAYHRGRFVSTPVDNPDQRIPARHHVLRRDSQSLALGAVSSAVSLVSFTIILWQLSGPLAVFGLQIPRGMVFLAYIYVIIATVFAFRIGRPLIRLNFLNELYGLLPLRPGAGPRQLREHCVLPGRAGGKRRAVGTLRGGHRQHLGRSCSGA